jgi:hypothetical protein
LKVVEADDGGVYRRNRLTPVPFRVLLGFLAVLVLISTTTAVVAAATPKVKASRVIKPVAVEFKVTPGYYSHAQLARVMHLAVEAGATAVYTVVNWNEVAPNAPRRYDWRALDRFVESAQAHHLRIRLQLSNSPDWLHPELVTDGMDPNDRHHTPPVGARQIAEWGDFAMDVARHFNGAVSDYEIWNEENYAGFWLPEPNVEQYLAVLRSAYDAIKSVNRSDTVLFGGLSRNDTGYLQAYYAAVDRIPDAPASKWFDMLDVHPYSDNRAPSVDESKWIIRTPYGKQNLNFLGLKQMHSVMEANGDGNKDIWIGEYGFTTQKRYPVNVTDRKRARWVIPAYRLAARLGYVRGLGWYSLMATPSDSSGYALVSSGWAKSDTYRAFITMKRTSPGGVETSSRKH